jgi:hypothetical protein
VIISTISRWWYDLEVDEKWPNYRDRAGQYLMSHKYHLVLYFWWEGWGQWAATKTMAATAMAGGTCNNQLRRAVEETTAATMVTDSGNNCDNGNKGSGNDGKRASWRREVKVMRGGSVGDDHGNGNGNSEGNGDGEGNEDVDGDGDGNGDINGNNDSECKGSQDPVIPTLQWGGKDRIKSEPRYLGYLWLYDNTPPHFHMAKPKWKCTSKEDGWRDPKERLKGCKIHQKNGTQKGRPKEENFA